MVVRIVVPVNSADPDEPLKLLQVIEPVPATLASEIAAWKPARRTTRK